MVVRLSPAAWANAAKLCGRSWLVYFDGPVSGQLTVRGALSPARIAGDGGA